MPSSKCSFNSLCVFSIVPFNPQDNHILFSTLNFEELMYEEFNRWSKPGCPSAGRNSNLSTDSRVWVSVTQPSSIIRGHLQYRKMPQQVKVLTSKSTIHVPPLWWEEITGSLRSCDNNQQPVTYTKVNVIEEDLLTGSHQKIVAIITEQLWLLFRVLFVKPLHQLMFL